MSLYKNIHATRTRIKAGSKEKMRKPGTKGAPTAKAFKKAAKTARKRK
jgi:cysteine sulfinate desulfinase/cysteine desulfurase-like protein